MVKTKTLTTKGKMTRHSLHGAEHQMDADEILPKIMTFRPTKEEFKDFHKYIEYMESQGAHFAGIARVIPPEDYKPTVKGYDDLGDVIIRGSRQILARKNAAYNIRFETEQVKDTDLVLRKFFEFTVSQYKEIAEAYCPPVDKDEAEMEELFWKNIWKGVRPYYCSDNDDSLFDVENCDWDQRNLGTILDLLKEEEGDVRGVTTPYVYYGMWKSVFCWHTEDMNLYSVNYLHDGAPKQWYSVPPSHGPQLEALADRLFEDGEPCQARLRHKDILIPPDVLRKNGIPFDKVAQTKGQIIVTFPYGFHAGFNWGFNIAEAVNFATLRWIQFGTKALQCNCKKGPTFTFSMDPFIKKYGVDGAKVLAPPLGSSDCEPQQHEPHQDGPHLEDEINASEDEEIWSNGSQTLTEPEPTTFESYIHPERNISGKDGKEDRIRINENESDYEENCGADPPDVVGVNDAFEDAVVPGNDVTPSRSYVCNICNSSYKQWRCLWKHKKDKHINANQQYICEVCSVSYSNHDNLVRHKRRRKHL